MKDVIKILERYFKTLQEIETNLSFALALGDYIKFIQDTPELNKIIKNLTRKRDLLKQKIIDCEKESTAELVLVKDNFLKIIKENKITSKELDEALEWLTGHFNGRVISGGSNSENIDSYLVDIGRILVGSGHKDKIKNYIKNINGEECFVFSEKLKEIRAIDKKLQEIRETELWGHWDYLECIANIVAGQKLDWFPDKDIDFNRTQIIIDIKENLGWSVREIIKIEREFFKNQNNSIVSNTILKKYKNYATRIHNYLIQELSKEESAAITKKSKQKGFIEKITIVEMNNGKHLIAINDKLKEAKQIKSSEWWEIFIREVKERTMQNRTNVKEIPKDMVDYFNYNIKKCPIYMGGKYNLTNIFVGRSIDTIINPEIKTEVIKERQYLARINRKK